MGGTSRGASVGAGGSLRLGGGLPRVAAAAVDFVALQGEQGCSLEAVWTFLSSKDEFAAWISNRKDAVWQCLCRVNSTTLQIVPSSASANKSAPENGKTVKLIAGDRARLQALRIPFPDVVGTEEALKTLETIASSLGKGFHTTELSEKLSGPQKGSGSKGGRRIHYLFDSLEELQLVEKNGERKASGSRNRMRHARFSTKEQISESGAEEATSEVFVRLRRFGLRIIKFMAAIRNELGVSQLAYGDVIFLLGIKSRALFGFLEQEWKAGRSCLEASHATIRLVSAKDRTSDESFFTRVARRASRGKLCVDERRVVILHSAPLANTKGEGSKPTPTVNDPDSNDSDPQDDDEAIAVARRILGMHVPGALHGVSHTQQLYEAVLAAGESGMSLIEMANLMAVEQKPLSRSFHKLMEGGPKVASKAQSLPVQLSQTRAVGKYNAVGMATARQDAIDAYQASCLAEERAERIHRLKVKKLLPSDDAELGPVQRHDRVQLRLNTILQEIKETGVASIRRLVRAIRDREVGMFEGTCDAESVRRLVERCQGEERPPGMPKLRLVEWCPGLTIREDGEIQVLSDSAAEEETTEMAKQHSGVEAGRTDMDVDQENGVERNPANAAEDKASATQEEAPLPPAADPMFVDDSGPPMPPPMDESSQDAEPPHPPTVSETTIDEENISPDENVNKGRGKRKSKRDDTNVADPSKSGGAGSNEMEIARSSAIGVQLVCNLDQRPTPLALERAAREKLKYIVARPQTSSIAQIVRIPNEDYMKLFLSKMEPGQTALDVFRKMDLEAAQNFVEADLPRKKAVRRKAMKMKAITFPVGPGYAADMLQQLLSTLRKQHGSAPRVLDYYFDVRLMVRSRLLHGYFLEYCKEAHPIEWAADKDISFDMDEALREMPVLLYLRLVKRPISFDGTGPSWNENTCERALEAALNECKVREVQSDEFFVHEAPFASLQALSTVGILSKTDRATLTNSRWVLYAKANFSFYNDNASPKPARNSEDVDRFWSALYDEASNRQSHLNEPGELWQSSSWAIFPVKSKSAKSKLRVALLGVDGKGKKKLKRKRQRKSSRKGEGHGAVRGPGDPQLWRPQKRKHTPLTNERVEPWAANVTKIGFDTYLQTLDMDSVKETLVKDEIDVEDSEVARKKLRSALEFTSRPVDYYKAVDECRTSRDAHPRVWALRKLVVYHLLQLARQDHFRSSARKFEHLTRNLKRFPYALIADVLDELVVCGFLRDYPLDPDPRWTRYFVQNINREAFKKHMKKVCTEMQRPRRILPAAFSFTRPSKGNVSEMKELREDITGCDLMRILPMFALGEASLSLQYQTFRDPENQGPPLMESERSRRAPRVPVSELKNTEDTFKVILKTEPGELPTHNATLPFAANKISDPSTEPMEVDNDAGVVELLTEDEFEDRLRTAGEDGLSEAHVLKLASDATISDLLKNNQIIKASAFHSYRYIHADHAWPWLLPSLISNPEDLPSENLVILQPWLQMDGQVDTHFKRSLTRALVLFVLDFPGTTRKAIFKSFYPILDLMHIDELLAPLTQGPDALIEIHVAEGGVELLSPSLRALDRRFLLPAENSDAS